MTSVARIWVAWELHKGEHEVEYIAEQVGRHRSTVYRWLKGIRLYGIKEFVRRYQNAKKGRRQRKTHPYIQQRVLSIRHEQHNCCGDKIVYWLAQEGITLSRSTVYRILNKLLVLRPRGRKHTPRGPLPRARRPREVLQMDTIDFGDVFAYSAIDVFTREGQVVLRETLTAEDGADALEELMSYFGFCHLIQTDGGSEFQADFAERVPAYAQRQRIARPYQKNEKPSSSASTGPSARNVWAGRSTPLTRSRPCKPSSTSGCTTIILFVPAWLSSPCVRLCSVCRI